MGNYGHAHFGGNFGWGITGMRILEGILDGELRACAFWREFWMGNYTHACRFFVTTDLKIPVHHLVYCKPCDQNRQPMPNQLGYMFKGTRCATI